MRFQNTDNGSWMSADIYKSKFLRKQLRKTIRVSTSIAVFTSVFLVCSKPHVLSTAYADTESPVTNNEMSKNTGIEEQTEGEDNQSQLTDDLIIADEPAIADTDLEDISEAFEDEDELEEIPEENEDEPEVEEIEEAEEVITPVLETLLVPNWEDGCRSYNITHMDYRSVTDRQSDQYELLNSDGAYTDEETGLRMYDGRIAIALGLGFGVKAGDYVNIVFENGYEFECIVGDIKANKDTDDTHRFQKYDGSVVEAITDKQYFTSTKNYPEGFRGTISQIIRLDKSYEFIN